MFFVFIVYLLVFISLSIQTTGLPSLEISNLPNLSSRLAVNMSKAQSYWEFPEVGKLIFAILVIHNKFSRFINCFSFINSFYIHINNANA